VRLFIAVRPPEPVLDQVADLVERLRRSALARGDDAVRWTTREQWHITLRFLGEVAEPEPVVTVLDQLGSSAVGATEATLGPQVEQLGRQVLCLPSGGLDELAAGVVAATAALGQPPDDRAFRGHLTLARIRRRARRSRIVGSDEDQGAGIDARWPVGEVVLVRSHLGRGGPRYEDLHVHSLSVRPRP